MKYICGNCSGKFEEPNFKVIDFGKFKGEKIAVSPCCMSEDFEEDEMIEENFSEEFIDEDVNELEEIYMGANNFESDLWDER